jgi:hypothetical protein
MDVMGTELKSASVVLKKDDHIRSVEFEVVQRPRPLGEDAERGGSAR